jgi:tellurite resistance protein
MLEQVMLKPEKISLLAKVARTPSRSRDGSGESSAPESSSILSLAAASYGARPDAEATVPTGFDPVAVALFEAIVEAAYLVAASDGVVDAEERDTFERVVSAACGGAVAPNHVADLVADLVGQLEEDGMDRRIQAVGALITKRSHAEEVLRIAALLAQASDSVSDVERQTLVRIAEVCKLKPADVDTALREVQAALAVA